MDTSELLASGLMAVAAQPLLLVLVIITATFILEDLATITVALLASQMVIDGPTAVAALVAGTILGDLAVFHIARRAAHVPLVARFLNGASLRPVRAWLRRNAIGVVLIARFTPGLRLPVFAGAGSFDMPARDFTIVIVLSTLVWTPALFWATDRLGMAGLERWGMFGWAMPGALIVLVALAPRLVSGVIKRGAARVVAA